MQDPGPPSPQVRALTRAERFLGACRRRPTDRTPVWFMRQAGRFLPAYRAIKERHSFLEMMRTPDLAAEITVLPLDLGVDAAIIFSDLMATPMAMGVEVEFAPGPVVKRPVRGPADLSRLRVPRPGEGAPWLAEAIAATRKALAGAVPLIGFVGAPFTMAGYVVEKGERPSMALDPLRALVHADPRTAERLLDLLARGAGTLALDQVRAGADAIQIFDSWAGVLSPAAYRRFAAPGARTVVEMLRPAGVPVIYYAGMTGAYLRETRDLGADVIGVDWRLPLDEAWSIIGAERAIQGNLDPAALLAPAADLDAAVDDVLGRAAGRPGHIFNLGHGVLPETDPARARAVVDRVHASGCPLPPGEGG